MKLGTGNQWQTGLDGKAVVCRQPGRVVFERRPFPRALLIDTLREGWFEQAQGLACAAVVTNHKVMEELLIARLHAANLRALVYTVNDAAEAQRLVALGIDGIITDAVDRFSPSASDVHG